MSIPWQELNNDYWSAYIVEVLYERTWKSLADQMGWQHVVCQSCRQLHSTSESQRRLYPGRIKTPACKVWNIIHMPSMNSWEQNEINGICSRLNPLNPRLPSMAKPISKLLERKGEQDIISQCKCLYSFY